MKKAYQKAFKQIKDYLEKGTLNSEPKALYYIDSCALGIINTAQSISKTQKIPIENVTSLDIMKNYLTMSKDFSEFLNPAFEKYIKYTFNDDNLRPKELEALKSDIALDLASYISVLKDVLSSCGALEHSRIQHNVSMSKLNLSKLSVTPEQINDEFNLSKNSRADLSTLITKAAFWTNKAVKYIENIKLGILLFEDEGLAYTKSNYKQITDKEKIIAIYKEQILTKLKNNISTQLPEDYSFNSLLILYSTVIQYQEDQDVEKVKNVLDKFGTIDFSIAKSLIEEINEFHTEYDNTFYSDKDSSNFLHDIYSVSNNFALEDDLYNYKTSSMVLLCKQLVRQSSLPVPYIKHFGNSYDPKLKNQVLSIDLPNYFMPASFHYDKNMNKMPQFEKFISKMPEYKGFFKNSTMKNSLSTHLLFTPSNEQRKYIREEFLKNKSHTDSYRTKVLSHMNAMVNGDWHDFNLLIDDSKKR